MKIYPIFDFDGVIVDSSDMCYKITKIEYPDITLEQYRDLYSGNIFNTLKQLKGRSTPEQQFNFFAYYEPEILKRPPVVGIRELLSKLDKKSIIISSTTSDPIRNYLVKHELIEFFESILGSDIEKSKELKLLKVKSEHPDERIIFVTDTLGDIFEANKVGIETIAVTWGFHNRERLLRGNPMRIVDSIEELTNIIFEMH